MPLTDQEYELVSEILAESGPIDRFIFKELLGEQRSIASGDGDFRRRFGVRFSQDVAAGRFPGIKWIGIKRSGRDEEYSYLPPANT